MLLTPECPESESQSESELGSEFPLGRWSGDAAGEPSSPAVPTGVGEGEGVPSSACSSELLASGSAGVVELCDVISVRERAVGEAFRQNSITRDSHLLADTDNLKQFHKVIMKTPSARAGP